VELPGVDAHPQARPALAAGCTVVLKPAEQTPLCAVEVFRILHDVGLPAGVANLVTASDPVPRRRRAARQPRGRQADVHRLDRGRQDDRPPGGRHDERVSLELGGHAPFLVFEDADPAHAAKGAAMVKLLNTGQACISPNRLYVHRSLEQEFVRVLTERVAR
jgi:succinate-semialdehyde dehydrogenase/glutarate-semialdehyde dehydrogenase